MLKISFLGGAGEFGKNMTLYEQDDGLLVVDCGSMFPEADAPGIDLIIPDFGYLRENSHRLSGLVLTHGHEDHIGAAPFLLREFPMPVFSSPLTLGFLARKLKELGLSSPPFTVLEAGMEVRVGPFIIEGIPVTHSVPDSLSILIHSNDATVLHSSDFKFDQSPLDHRLTHYNRFYEAGRDGVTAMVIDSTNADVEGMVGSETQVLKTLEEYVARQKGTIFISLFSTNLMRVQTIFDLAARYGRKTALFGRSLVQNTSVGEAVGYLHIPAGTRIAPEEIDKLPRDKVVVLVSGSQAEPFSALNRIAFDTSKFLHFEKDDILIVSARIIPGNEKRVARLINQVYRKGAEVITNHDDRVHVSGHGAQEELKLLTSWTRPDYYVPVHGEYRQQMENAKLAEEMGYPEERILVCDTGESLFFEEGRFTGRGKVSAGSVFIDQDTADSVDRAVVRDRRHLSNDGIVVPIVVINAQAGRIQSEPEIISRGYPYLNGESGCMDEIRSDLATLLRTMTEAEIKEVGIVKAKVKATVKKTLKRNEAKIPLIIPVVMEI